MVSNSFLVIVGDPKRPPLPGPNGLSFNEGRIQLLVERPNPRYMAVHAAPDAFGVYVGDGLHTAPEYATRAFESGWDPASDNGGFVRFDPQAGEVRIESDFLGSELLYYAAHDGRAYVSNRPEPIAQRTGGAPDFLGVKQFLLGSHTVGKRTCIEGLHQTRPLERVVIDTSTLATSEVASGQWAIHPERDYSADAMAALWAETLEGSPPSVLMLSAGWDSRLLLAHNRSRLRASYSHGDLTSRELRLVFELAAGRIPTLRFNSASVAAYGVDTITEMLDRVGYALFPHWFYAAGECAELTDAPLTAGVYAEHLAGQFGTTSLGTTRTKATYFLKGLLTPDRLDTLSDEEVIALSLGFLDIPLGNHWFLPDSWPDIFGDVDARHRADVESTLRGYLAEGTRGTQEVFERYRIEQSARQYFARQSRCGTAFNGFHHPYADSRLSRAVLEIPFRHRIHYTMSRAILSRLDPGLLETPLAATLVKASAPIFVQESSRVLRKTLEGLDARVNRKSSLRLGWPNFQFLLETDVFEDYIESLSADFWDKPKMRRSVERFKGAGRNAFEMLDMFGKILTVDHWVGGRTA